MASTRQRRGGAATLLEVALPIAIEHVEVSRTDAEVSVELEQVTTVHFGRPEASSTYDFGGS